MHLLRISATAHGINYLPEHYASATGGFARRDLSPRPPSPAPDHPFTRLRADRLTMALEPSPPMLSIALSRGRRRATYHLLTPPNRYASRLAELPGTTVFKLATPRTGTARFGQYLLELSPGGGSPTPTGHGFEHFLFCLDGEPTLDGLELPSGAFAYVPQGDGITLINAVTAPTARVMWLKRRYEPVDGLQAPAPLRGHRERTPALTTPIGVLRSELLPPDDPAYDFNISLLAFPPGVSLGQVEIHDEEHGLYMTRGSGIYHLDGSDHEVIAGDFVYMAPYCPQSFTPTGPETAEYLLYKDVYRDGF